MKLKYIGKSFGVDGLTDGKIYECLAIEQGGKLVRIIDDSENDYLYSASNPAPMDESSPGGKWEIVEDGPTGTLSKTIK